MMGVIQTPPERGVFSLHKGIDRAIGFATIPV